MKILPFENICYKSKLEPNELMQRIEAIIEPRKKIRLRGIFTSKTYHEYEGTIQGNTFQISRIIFYRNSFLPIISGTIFKDLEGSIIQVKMRLNIFVLVFMLIWMVGVFIACVVVTFLLLSFKSFYPPYLIPYGMLAFGILLFNGGFKMESIPSKKYLATLFEAEIMN